MPDLLPPLNAVRAFDVAARHKSFTKAAKELFVTHGAVSRQIKNLEAFLGQDLFIRRPRELVLTSAGTAYALVVHQVLEQLAEATQVIKSETTREKLTVSVIPSFASRWLVPRLEVFNDRYPDWEILISASLNLVDLARDGIDLAIRFGRGSWPGLQADYLFSTDYIPVCAKSIMEGEHPLVKPEDLCHHKLLHDYTRESWTTWLRLSGVKGIDVKKDPLFTDANITIQAAIEGRGVVLANRRLVLADLEAGRLVAPFTLSLSDDVAYFTVYRKGTGDQPKIKAMRDWLLEEAQSSEWLNPLQENCDEKRADLQWFPPK